MGLGLTFLVDALALALSVIDIACWDLKPDGMEKSTQAWPGKLTCCFAENEARSPWEPLHVERGDPAETSTVTVVAIRGLYAMTDEVQTTGLEEA